MQYDTTFFNDFKNSHTEIALPMVLRAFKNQFWEKKTGWDKVDRKPFRVEPGNNMYAF